MVLNLKFDTQEGAVGPRSQLVEPRNLSVLSFSNGLTHWAYQTSHLLSEVSQPTYWEPLTRPISHTKSFSGERDVWESKKMFWKRGDLIQATCSDGFATLIVQKSLFPLIVLAQRDLEWWGKKEG